MWRKTIPSGWLNAFASYHQCRNHLSILADPLRSIVFQVMLTLDRKIFLIKQIIIFMMNNSERSSDCFVVISYKLDDGTKRDTIVPSGHYDLIMVWFSLHQKQLKPLQSTNVKFLSMSGDVTTKSSINRYLLLAHRPIELAHMIKCAIDQSHDA